MKVLLHKVLSKKQRIVPVLLHVRESPNNFEWALIHKLTASCTLIKSDTVLYASEEGQRLLEQEDPELEGKFWVRLDGQFPQGTLLNGEMTNAEAVRCLQGEESF